MPSQLAGRTIEQSKVRDRTGCTVVAIVSDDHSQVNPDARHPLPADGDLVLVGDAESEHRFLSQFRSG